MKKFVLAIIVLALAMPLAAATWKDVALMDAGCAAHKEKIDAADTHSKSCMMRCAKGGYGAIVDGKFVKFDAKGNELTEAALKKTEKTDHLRADVTGEEKDGVISVTAIDLK